jgi:hypothetical protein
VPRIWSGGFLIHHLGQHRLRATDWIGARHVLRGQQSGPLGTGADFLRVHGGPNAVGPLAGSPKADFAAATRWQESRTGSDAFSR